MSSIQASTTKASYHEAARRPPLQCIVEGQSVASPGQLILEGKVKEEFLDSARRGHEDEGGEGHFGGDPGCPGGAQFFLCEDINMNICLSWSSLSLLQVKVKFDLASFYFV